jgi:hypothetical protein
VRGASGSAGRAPRLRAALDGSFDRSITRAVALSFEKASNDAHGDDDDL